MSPQTLVATLNFISKIAGDAGMQKAKITFHGGEPLQAGHDMWRQALEGIDRRFERGRYKVALQSNLWLLDDEFCQLFAKYEVEIGTSVDGPAEITDHQRGRDYFARTMRGVQLAKCYGLNVGCIATFTPYSAPRWREVFDFFLASRLNFSIHAAVPPLDAAHGQHAISPEQYGVMLCEMLDYYVEHRREISVSSFDQMCQGFGCGDGKVCTFRDCLGMFLAVDPCGDIYPCQRFCGKPAYRLGKLADKPTLTDLLNSPIAKRMSDRQGQMRSACTDCSHFDYCKGGCPYNAWVGTSLDRLRDPYCTAYKQTFDNITQGALDEMASEENIEAVAANPYNGNGHPLLRKGRLIELIREGPHPSRITRTAKRIVAAVELAREPNIPSVAARLLKMGICRTQQSAEASLAALQRDLQPKPGLLNNLYLHVTLNCQLHCTHCYAHADATGHRQWQMGVGEALSLVLQAKDVAFRQVIVTGGEPLVHSQRGLLLKGLQTVRRDVSPLKVVLRTNFAMPLDTDSLQAIALAFDQVVVSVDGTAETHDERRGPGSYAATLQNLEAYRQVAIGLSDAAELSLATVMGAEALVGEPGDSVRMLAKRLGITRTRFRPVLPLGRAADWKALPVAEALGAHADPMELIEDGFSPAASCGMGQNLFVEPSGESFPCYACRQSHFLLGNVVLRGLATILDSKSFTDLSQRTVDTNFKCSRCDLRYLCGGACRAWDGSMAEQDLDRPPRNCAGLRQRAEALFEQAMVYLGIQARTGGDHV